MSMTTDLDKRYLIDPDAVAGGTAQLTATPAEINTGMDGITATATEINAICDRSAQGSVLKVLTHDIAVFTTAETTILTTPAGAIILDVILNITDAAAESGNIDIGTTGTSDDPDGFFNGFLTDALACVSARDANTRVTGINDTYISAVYGGALLFSTVINTVGTDANLDTGSNSSRPAYLAAADGISYTLSETHTSFAASISVIYLDLVS